MVKAKHFAAALVFAACAGNISASYENSANTTEATAAIAPMKDALVTLETSAYEAWKSKDAKFWEPRAGYSVRRASRGSTESCATGGRPKL